MDNGNTAFGAGLFLGIGVCALMFIITPVKDGVRIEDYTRSVKVCEVHDGVSKVLRPEYAHGEYTTICKDGVKVVMTTFQD